MADGMFGAPTGGGTALSSGSPEYQQAIVQNTQKQLAPMYRQALQGQMQSMAGRGLMDSGTAIAARAGAQQDYLRQMGDVATKAATQGADVALQNQRMAQQHQWDIQNQERLLNFQREMADRQEQAAGQGMWSNLLGMAAGGVGQGLGSYLGGMFGSKKPATTGTTPPAAGG